MREPKSRLRRAGDTQFKWVVPQLGEPFSDLVNLAQEWLARHASGIDLRMHALALFFDRFLHKQRLPADVSVLFASKTRLPDFYGSCCPQSASGIVYNNYVCDFADWILKTRFSRNGELRGVSTDFKNPVQRRTRGRATYVPSETVRTPLPYRYIVELRNIIASGRSFRDWTWASSCFGDAARNGDWFAVDESLINEHDPDCVWRKRSRGKQQIFEMWSPVRFVAILSKLLVPLRTYQVRMLDSGEADSLRYAKGTWNTSAGPLTSSKAVQQGVFRRVVDADLRKETTVLYINSNKTADVRRQDGRVGYVIPWQHDELLYWLEKLRDWQERYNAIQAPTKWVELEVHHLGNAKSQERLATFPDTCFLFRDAGAIRKNDRPKPIASDKVERGWYSLLAELENRCALRKETLSTGARLRFVRPGSVTTTYFPLHSLRVSLLTCLALDGDVPLPILSKLVAGHSRLMMTLYYIKAGPARVSRLLKEAETRMSEGAETNLRSFLEEASYEQLLAATACNSPESMKAALPSSPSERIAAGWSGRSLGICLVGANSSTADVRTLAGCHNGGPQMTLDNAHPNAAAFAPVPGGAGNCVRCRWFITEPRYLDALRAHFNTVSYRLSETAGKARTIEVQLSDIKAVKAESESAGAPFMQQAEYLRLERLWETTMTETDQLANDLIATLRLVNRCLTLLGLESEGSNAVIAAGATTDIRMALQETDSELLQLAEICHDAEVYPDEDYGKAVLRRSQILDSALMREGAAPIFLSFSEHEQLRLGNHLMRRLALLSEKGKSVPAGLERVVGVLESRARLQDMFDLDAADLLFSVDNDQSHIPLITASGPSK